MLAAKGLVTSRPKVGSTVEPRENWNLLDRDVLAWHVAAMDAHEFLASVQEIRKILEPGIARLAAAKRTPAQIRAIRAALDDMSEAPSPGQTVDADVRFHLAVLTAANNDLLRPFGIIVELAFANMFGLTSRLNTRPGSEIPLHAAILAAIEKGDGRKAETAVQALLNQTDKLIGTGRRTRKPRPGQAGLSPAANRRHLRT
jgi:DNA-binding FadR family transcriptional regulator